MTRIETCTKMAVTRRLFDGLMLILLGENVVQHVFVSYAFLYDVGDIRSWVVLDYRKLLFSGAGVAMLFLVAVWGMFKEKDGAWAT